MKIIAHRGACTEALENSWEAFHKAVDAGAERIELDVHLTRDGHLAVVHDENFQKTAGSPLVVAESTRDEIAGRIKLNNGEAVPFLDQLFESLLDKIEFNVEIKSKGRATVEAVAALVQAQKWSERIIVSSFHLETCRQLASDFPGIKTALLWDKSLWWPGAFEFGPKRFMRKTGIRIFHPDVRLVEPRMVETIHAQGWTIVPYVGLKKEQNTRELWTYLASCGIDGLCTNYPREMKLWLQEATDDSQRFQSISALAHRAP